MRHTRYPTWRDSPRTVVRVEGDWVRLRLRRPDRESASVLGRQCVERGIYEACVPGDEAGAVRDVDQPYEIRAAND